MMVHGGYRHVPIVEGGKLVGSDGKQATITPLKLGHVAYRVTDVRFPGVSPAGIAFIISSARL